LFVFVADLKVDRVRLQIMITCSIKSGDGKINMRKTSPRVLAQCRIWELRRMATVLRISSTKIIKRKLKTYRVAG